ncbi:MAG: hypothetical protein JSU86_09865 [Phycisphaerales bacterium]|nr:MAG: hypothetical protein JSU86_09865 [Phycisphaerales bacterium]
MLRMVSLATLIVALLCTTAYFLDITLEAACVGVFGAFYAAKHLVSRDNKNERQWASSCRRNQTVSLRGTTHGFTKHRNAETPAPGACTRMPPSGI